VELEKGPFLIHAYHIKQIGLDCDACHVPAKAGSVVLQRPGHDQCMACHQDDFGEKLNPKVCAECHTAFPPTGSGDLLPFPRFKNQRPLLLGFSHARHVDPHGRIDPRTGLRADCTFCHRFEGDGKFASIPGHVQCASCHSKIGMTPHLTADSTTADCRGCHNPEQIENPLAASRPQIPLEVISGRYTEPISFSHADHLKSRAAFHADCTTCHSEVLSSTSLLTLGLPKMASCATCHETSQTMPAHYRMSNCGACHAPYGREQNAVYSRLIKPASHTESFRVNHAQLASAPGADCFVCHTNIQPSQTASQQCQSCHTVMRPVSHTARWRDDIHGKYAALDRKSCALCHTADSCIRCHNELPRSHVPLGVFEGGAHARLAMLNERSCFTCHTFENTCSECHTRILK
jgi:hypothetical protein